MIDDQEIVRAKAVLRNAGYYCIPREKVLRVQAEKTIDHLTMARYGDERGYIESVIKDMHVSLGIEMMKARVCSLHVTQDNSTINGCTYRLKAAMLPDDLPTDPLLDFMREKQG